MITARQRLGIVWKYLVPYMLSEAWATTLVLYFGSIEYWNMAIASIALMYFLMIMWVLLYFKADWEANKW